MAKYLVPSRKDLMYPILLALKVRDGSASIHELADQVTSDMNLSDEILNIPSVSSTRTMFKYNMAWARSNLRKAKLIERPLRTIWTITALGRKIQSEDELHKFIRQKNLDRPKVPHVTNKPKGTPWSSQEIDLTVATYFDMLQMEQRGEVYVKLHSNEILQEQIGRTHKAIEYKHQNISAILQNLALHWIHGYKPAVNYQKALIQGVECYLAEHPEVFKEQNLSLPTDGLIERKYLAPEPAPTQKLSAPKALQRLIGQYDPATRDARNQELGKLGEERILVSEQTRLTSVGRKDLARKVKWVSEKEGDGAGYDILSFNDSGDERLLEVKTTSGHKYTPFYLTKNELQLSIERPNEFRLIRVYNFMQSPKVFKLTPPLEQAVTLRPTHYQASFYYK